MSAAQNMVIAEQWLDAFNRHDVDSLVRLYAPGATHTSPKIRAAHPGGDGKLVGRAALKNWWLDSLKRFPELRYAPTVLTANGERVFMEYVRHAPGQADMPVAEVLDVSEGLIVASRVYHG
jgi:hypothetical protein